MIQVNLLPDIKIDYLKAQRNKHSVMGGAFLVSLVAVGLTVLLALHVYVNQAKHLRDLQTDITNKISELQAIENLDTILTVNQQLLVLPDLHDQKPAVERLPDLLLTMVPGDIELTDLSIDFEALTVRLRGQGLDTKTVNTFADILKNVNYLVEGNDITTKIFSGVEFNEFGVVTVEGVSFEATMSFNAEIFDRTTNSITFSVPSIISTQSSIRTSNASLFDVPAEEVQP